MEATTATPTDVQATPEVQETAPETQETVAEESPAVETGAETTEGTPAVVEGAKAEPEVKEAVKEAVEGLLSDSDLQGKMVRLKIDGEERNLPLAELVRRVQKGESASQKFEEAAKVRKQAETVIRALKENPLGVLRHPSLGFTEDQITKMMEEALYEKVQLEQMTPEQRELHTLKKKIAADEATKKMEAEQAQRQELEQLTKHHQENYQKQIIDALEAARLPKSSGTVKRMAFYMREALRRNIRVEPKDVVDDVRRDIENEFRDMFGAAPTDQLLGILGDDLATKLRKHDLEKLPKADDGTVVEPTKVAADKPSKMMTKDEWRAEIERRANS